MPKTKYTPEEIVAKLRQVDVLLGQGKTVGESVKSIGVTETYHRWRNEYGGLKLDQVKRLKAVEAENSRLRRAVRPRTRGACGCTAWMERRMALPSYLRCEGDLPDQP